MASAQGRILTSVSGSIENGKAHYGFTRNGKQFIGCIRKGWNGYMTETQKIQSVKFANLTRCANALWAFFKDGDSAKGASVISGVVNVEDINKGYYAQQRDENGYYFPHATIKDFISGVVAKGLTEEQKKTVIEAAEKPYFAETLEGYEAMKTA